MSPTLLVVIGILSVAVKTVQGDQCDDSCDSNRPPGNDGPYTLECSSLKGNDARFCGLFCRQCQEKCDGFDGFSPERSKIRCGSKQVKETSFGGAGGTLGAGIIILIVVLVVGCIGLCVGIPACIFCCRQRNRYPVMQAGGMGYGGYGATPMMAGGGGGAVVTSTSYSTGPVQQVQSGDSKVYYA